MLSEFFEFLSGVWQELLACIVMLIAGYCLSEWKNLNEWRRKKFKDKINLSLNIVTPTENKYIYNLEIRTLMEKNINEFFKNKYIVKMIKKACKKTEPGKPLLIFSENDSWYILNSILNQIAYHFADGIIKKDMGINVNSEWYTFCLTFEKEGKILMQKLRIMIIKREILRNFPNEDVTFIYESDTHDIRVQTLRTLSKELREHPECFMDIEICQ